MNNSETYVLKYTRFNTYLILIFNDLNKAQIFKIPYRDSPHHEIEIIMSFNCLLVFKPIEYTEDYHIRKPNDGSFRFQNEDKN